MDHYPPSTPLQGSCPPGSDSMERLVVALPNHQKTPNMQTGIELIAAERERQITAEGYTTAHDDQHTGAELVIASNQYSSYAAIHVRSKGLALAPDCFLPKNWPWEREAWKPSDDPIRNLVKAGALIAAEIDRLSRHNGVYS